MQAGMALTIERSVRSTDFMYGLTRYDVAHCTRRPARRLSHSQGGQMVIEGNGKDRRYAAMDPPSKQRGP